MPPLTVTTAVTTWEFAPLVSFALAVLAVAYLAGVRAVARRYGTRPWHFPEQLSQPRTIPSRRAWPVARTASFLCGLAMIAVATQGSPGRLRQ